MEEILIGQICSGEIDESKFFGNRKADDKRRDKTYRQDDAQEDQDEGK